MSNKTTRRGGFSPTKFVLVAILLSAIVFVTDATQQPPPGPPVPPKEPTAQEIEQRQKMAAQEMKSKMETYKKVNAQSNKPAPPDPNGIEVDNKIFLSNPSGDEGLKKMDAEVARRKADFDAYMKEKQKEEANPKLQKTVESAEDVPVRTIAPKPELNTKK